MGFITFKLLKKYGKLSAIYKLCPILKVDTNQEILTMKKTFLSISVLFLISFSLFAQDSGQKNLGSIGFSYSSFGNIQETWNSSGLNGGDNYVDEKFYTFGIDYLRPINTWLEYEFGLEYSRQTYKVQPEFPSLGYPEHNIYISLISVPATLRANFLKYFFANGGLLLDFDLNSSSPVRYQSGIGCLLGVAAKYDFKFGASIYFNPFIKYHSVIPFSSEDYNRLTEVGFRLGLTYNLNHLK